MIHSHTQLNFQPIHLTCIIKCEMSCSYGHL